MDDGAEKMAALKKVYADIILNTARESAARIIASERRALTCQQSLFAAKEEALSTLLRLKSLMDSKIQEAEKTSLGHERRIQDLEYQLTKAEDTICHLREELKRVNNKVEKMSNDLHNPTDGQNENGHTTSYNVMCLENELRSDSKRSFLVGPANAPAFGITSATSSPETRDNHCSLSENATQTKFLKDVSAEKGPCNSDLVSIIMRSQEYELYKNGCTQRIRAFEHNAFTLKVPIEQSDVQLSVFNNEWDVSASEKSEGSHSEDSIKPIKVVAQELNGSRKGAQEESNHGDGHDVKFLNTLIPRKQRTKCIQVKDTNFVTSPEQDISCHEPFDVEGSNISAQGKGVIESGLTTIKKPVSEEPTNRILNLCSGMVTAVGSRDAEVKIFSSNKSFSKANIGLLQCSERSVCKQNLLKQSALDSQIEIPQRPTCCTEENIEHGNNIANLILLSTADMKDGSPMNPGAQNDVKTMLQVDDSTLTTTSHHNVEENVNISSVRDDVLLKSSDVKDETTCESNGTLARPGKDKFLKYTFQRTRKRGSSSGKNESILPEKKMVAKRKFGDEESALLESQKPSLVTELPRNNRRLVQVARQLISLSEKRW